MDKKLPEVTVDDVKSAMGVLIEFCSQFDNCKKCPMSNQLFDCRIGYPLNYDDEGFKELDESDVN